MVKIHFWSNSRWRTVLKVENGEIAITNSGLFDCAEFWNAGALGVQQSLYIRMVKIYFDQIEDGGRRPHRK